MSNTLAFTFENTSLTILGDILNPLFIAKQICDVLGFANHKDAIKNSEDYTEDDGNSGMKAREVDMRDADFLNVVWQNFSAPGTEVLSIGTHGLNVRTAKLIVLLYVFGSQSSLSKAGKRIWNIKRRKLDRWTEDALIFFAFRIRYFEQINERKVKDAF